MFKEIDEHIEGLKEELALSAGIDPLADSYKRGAITALRDILNIEIGE